MKSTGILIVSVALFVTQFFCLVMIGFAQRSEYRERSILKVNVPALLVNTYQLQSEYLVHRKFSLVLSARYMPSGQIPYAGQLASFFDDVSEADLTNATLENYAVSPEIRYYLGNKGMGRGFYIAPFFRIATYRGSYADLSLDFDLDDTAESYQSEVSLDGKLNSLTGGIYIGKQWRFARKFYLDWWIIGASYGRANGFVSGVIPLDTAEQESVRQELDVNVAYPVLHFRPSVNSSGVYADVESFWAGLRTGLCVGFLLY